MHRSSESVAALATALAKAQTELVNPEKSLTATLWDERRGQGARTFRYAPLASGLDIVRKTLGQHELAIVQTTGVDQASGTIKLTTMLAHKSGEWISSEWPVCRLADMAAPHRMGAALTYARRYALFALVGIAGEDDLDAPDLKVREDARVSPMGGPDCHHVQQRQANDDSIDPAEVTPPQRPASRRHDRQLVLDADESATLRAQLLEQIAGLPTGDEAIAWARSALPSKNRLTKPDAGMVEQAFEARMGVLNAEMHEEPGHGLAVRPGLDEVAGIPGSAPANLAITAPATPAQTAGRIAPAGIDKNSLAYGVSVRRRDKAHLKYVAAQACLICGRQPSDPHHLRFAQATALGRKVSDEFTVPLCRSHHRELHRSGREKQWWDRLGIDPVPVAERLWKETHQPEGPQVHVDGAGDGPGGPADVSHAAMTNGEGQRRAQSNGRNRRGPAQRAKAAPADTRR